MAKNRMINTKFWSDTYVSNLDPLEKLLFLYFITNPYTNICGIYEISLKQIALDTGIDKENLEKVLLPRFNKAGKIYYIDGWIFIKNFLKHQKSSGNIQLGVENGFKEVPNEIMAKIKTIKDTGGSDVGHSLKLELESKLESEPKLKSEKQVFAFDDFNYFLSSKQRHIQVIGLYLRWKKIVFRDENMRQTALRRNTRPAKDLISFTDKELEDSFAYMDKKLGFDSWSLQAVYKYASGEL